jgi:hypothetical protein
MKGRRYLYAGAAALAIAGLGLSVSLSQADAPRTPRYAVDGSWPKMPLPSAGDWGTPLVISTSTGKPKPWSTGEVAGTCVDSRDHVFIVTRGNLVNSPETLDSVSAAPVIEFNQAGDVVNAWGDRNVLPNGIHGCFIDYQDNIWIAGNGDGIVQKYSHNGKKLLLQIGTRGVCDWPANHNACGNSGGDPSANQSKTLLNEPANVWIDPGPDPVTGRRGSIYIADGYGNHRVIVFDADTGAYKRHWGAYGKKPAEEKEITSHDPGGPSGYDPKAPPSQVFNNPVHCVKIANDGLVYVCDRINDRVQVFRKDGTFVREWIYLKDTLASGSVWDLYLWPDREQSFFINVDGANNEFRVVRRSDGEVVGTYGRYGRQAGQFYGVHNVAIDSRGNVFTTEVFEGKRIQRWKVVSGAPQK